MPAGLEFNFRPLEDAMQQSLYRVDAATAVATAEAGHVLERFIKLELNKGSHPKGTKTGSAPGEPPWKITGTLQRSVQTQAPKRLGPLRYEVETGPTVIYGRAQELGHPRWPSGVTHPYVAPGVHAAEVSGQIERVAVSAWRRALGL